MSNEKSCPTKQDLERLMLGQLPESDTARLAGHLEECDQCIEAVRTLTPHDTLVWAMRHSPAAAADLPTGEQVQMLIEHVRGLVGQPATADTNVTDSAGTPAPSSSPSHEQPTLARPDSATAPHSDVYDFLAPPQSADELGRLGTYRVLKVLGAGGMGIVFLAEDIHLERQVALKAMKPALAASESAKKRFLREARAAAAIEHDHIIGIHHVGEDRGVPYLAMPLLRGESLDERLSREGKLSLDETLRIGREIAEGLAAAHDRGLIHRDIKPGNVFLSVVSRQSSVVGRGSSNVAVATGKTTDHGQLTTDQYRVKILDFGLARAADDASHLTQSGAIAGTPAYMAPEQAQGETVDQRCDLFGLGCVLYRCVTGVPPFQGKSAMAVLIAVTQSHPKSVRELDATVPVEVEKLISRLLEKNPAQRFQAAHDVVAEIARLEQKQAVIKREAEAKAVLASTSLAAPAILTATGPHPVAEGPPIAATRTSRRTVGVSPLVAEGPPSFATRTAPSGTLSRWRTIAIAAGALFALVFAGVVYRIQTDKGTLVVEINDEAVEARLKTDGLLVTDKSSGSSYTLAIKLGETSKTEPTGSYAVVSPEGFRLHVTDDNGAELNASEFKLTRGGTVRVRVTLEPLATASKTQSSTTDTADPDRRVAEWVLSIGGYVADGSTSVSDDPQHGYLKKGAPLPAGPWKLVAINLNQNLQVTDNDFDRLAELTELKHIYANDTLITDAALAKIKHLTKIDCLVLNHSVGHRPRGPVITDAGLAHLKNMKELRVLQLGGARQVTDAGLANLHDHTKLSDVNLGYTGITDAGLAHLKQSSGMGVLQLIGTSISDKGLEHLAGMKNLTHLYLSQTRVTDAGLKQLECPDLTKLLLGQSGVTDAGLDDLKRFAKLTYLGVNQTKVTAEGVQKFHQALPQCRIHSDHGDFEPTADPDRRVAEWVMSIGGYVADGSTSFSDDPQHGYLKKGAPLPAGPWKLVVINLKNNPHVTDNDFERLAELTELKYIYAENTLITDAALAKIKHLTKIDGLMLDHHVGQRSRGALITDAGLAHLKNMKELTVLHLGGARQVTDAGLANLHDHTKLLDVALGYTGITDAGLAHLKQCSGMAALHLNRTSISDKGLEHLVGMKDLWYLNLYQTRVTDAGLKRLECPNLKYLDVGLTDVTDAGLDDLKRFPKLTFLGVNQTKVTAEGVQKFHQALPQCRIQSSHGNFEPTADPDRRAAEAMLKFGNVTVRIGGQLRRIEQVDALPAENFHIEEVFVGMNDRFTDDDLEVLRGLPSLRSLKLDAEHVTDVGVAHLRGFPELEALSLPNSQLTDAGLDAIQGMTKLRELFLSHTQVSDAGLARLRGLSQLTLLDVGCTRVTDAGTVHLRDLTRLRDLRLNDNKLSDAGLANIKALSRLRSLTLSNTAVTSAGLEHLADLKELEHLLLDRTQVTDEGLEHLKKFVRLRQLWLFNTAVTDTGLAALRPLTNLSDLSLGHAHGVTDLGLEQLRHLTALRSLNLVGTRVTDAGLDHLRELTRLDHLHLEYTSVTPAGMRRLREALPKCKIESDHGTFEPTLGTDADRPAARPPGRS